MNEIFVAVKEIDYIEAQIDTLCDKYNSRRGTDFIQKRALFCVLTILASAILLIWLVINVKALKGG